jgi:hypothetical protein
MLVADNARADFNSPFNRSRRGPFGLGAASTLWAPAGSHTV